MSGIDTTPDECFHGIILLDCKNYFHELLRLKMILICIYHSIMLMCIGIQMNAYLLQGC